LATWPASSRRFCADRPTDSAVIAFRRWHLSALVTGWILWLSFTVARMLVHDLFDTRSLKLTALNALNEFITVTAMALIIGLWPPAGV